MYLIILYICSVCQVFVKQKAPIHPTTNTFGWGVLGRSDKKKSAGVTREVFMINFWAQIMLNYLFSNSLTPISIPGNMSFSWGITPSPFGTIMVKQRKYVIAALAAITLLAIG